MNITQEFNELQEIFIAYIIFDLVKMLYDKCTRKDLYFHHIFILSAILIMKYNGYAGFLVNIIIFNEIISVVSGIDNIAIEENKMREIMIYKNEKI